MPTKEQRAVQSFHLLLTFRGRSPHPPRIHLGSSCKQIIPAQGSYVGHCPLPLPTPSKYQADPQLLTLRGSYTLSRRSNEMRNPLFPLLSPEHVFCHLSSCIWNLGVFSGRCTGESLPLRVDFIHRVEFGEVSGHRVLTKSTPPQQFTPYISLIRTESYDHLACKKGCGIGEHSFLRYKTKVVSINLLSSQKCLLY